MRRKIDTRAFTEVQEIINYFPKEIKNKIPTDFLDFIDENANDKYKFRFDDSKSLEEQNLLPDTEAILIMIYRNYFCSEKEKKNIDKALEEKERRHQENIVRQYHQDILGERRKTSKFSRKQETSMVVYKASIVRNVVDRIKNFWREKFHFN